MNTLLQINNVIVINFHNSLTLLPVGAIVGTTKEGEAYLTVRPFNGCVGRLLFPASEMTVAGFNLAAERRILRSSEEIVPGLSYNIQVTPSVHGGVVSDPCLF